MVSLLIQLDEPVFRALNRVAPAAKRQRSEFVRNAIRKAIFEAEELKTRQAYLTVPDSEAEADDWSSAEPWDTATGKAEPKTAAQRPTRRGTRR